MIKKTIALLLVLSMCFSLASVAFAAEAEQESDTNKEALAHVNSEDSRETVKGDFHSNLGQMELHLNEYQVLKNLSDEYVEAKENNTLSESKFAEMSEEEIETIEDYQGYFSDKVEMLQGWTDEQLQSAGYTEAQIYTIRNFDGSEASMMSLASDCKVNAQLKSYNNSASGSSATVLVWFNWTGIHSNNFNDIFALVWSSPFKEVSSSGYVKYKNYENARTLTVNHSPAPKGLYGSYIEFPKYKIVTHDGTYYITGGSMTLNLSANANVLDFTAYCEYGYTHLNPNPGFSLDGSGLGVSISFDVGISTLDSARVNN